ncbi:MAG TPA: MFS transporter [Thermomicrobiales bacterium]|jgi:MFS family permease|nr:MFS transporter [Thermomicrobiales bacterium]
MDPNDSPENKPNGKTRNESIRETLRNKPFLRLWVAQAVSQTANNMVNFALLLRVRNIVDENQLTQANTAISLVILAFSLPAVLFGPLAGVVADRWNRRTIMAVVNVLRVVTVIGILFIPTTGEVNSILIAHYVGTFFFGMAGQFFAPAQGATIPALVSRGQLISANALFNLTATGAQVLGFAALGPVLVQVLGVDDVILLTAPLFLICAGLVVWLPKNATSSRALAVPDASIHPMERLWIEMREGLVYIARDPMLIRAIVYLTLAATTFLMVAALGPDFITSVVGLRPEDIGYIVAPAGIGVVVGVLTVGRISSRLDRDRLIDWALIGAGATIFLAAISSDVLTFVFDHPPVAWEVVLAGTLLFFAGVCNAYVIVPAQTLLQERSADEMRARVYATFFTISNSVAFIPIFFAAAFADLYGVVQVLVVVAMILLVLGGGSVYRRHRISQARQQRG